MNIPTIAQRNAVAFAPTPFAIISVCSSCYVVYYLTWKEHHKLKRLYHRLVLTMNLTLIPYSMILACGILAVPEGTSYYPDAVGTIQTCTAVGFLKLMFSLAVPTYYGSLILQAFMGMKYNFKEEKYRWVEKWVHLVAYGIPFAIASVIAATENFNPRITGAGCGVGKAPLGCESDPNVPCQRGDDIANFKLILTFGFIFLYFIFPPCVVVSMYCWIGRMPKTRESRVGMQQIRYSARRKLIQSLATQISVYLISFWSTWILFLIARLYESLTSVILYELLIFARCLFASQGFIFGMVYFSLQRLGKQKVYNIHQSSSPKPRQYGITVSDIRSNIQDRDISATTDNDEVGDISFSIFDGTPSPDSPWAKYFFDDNQEIDMPQREEEAPTNNDDDDIEEGTATIQRIIVRLKSIKIIRTSEDP